MTTTQSLQIYLGPQISFEQDELVGNPGPKATSGWLLALKRFQRFHLDLNTFLDVLAPSGMIPKNSPKHQWKLHKIRHVGASTPAICYL
jgi:hypothetical protein|mmetsp:Transcript_5398/g.9778  ORF Transcript_5398/g.9778 Transcript_5398/m.9778 type:complete len:89 (+) Transcript_5398:678-944(+)